MTNIAIIGATGYTGIELVKILYRHSYARLCMLTTRQKEPIPIHRLVPTLPANIGARHASPLPDVRNHSYSDVKKKCDVIFLCLPHTEAMDAAGFFLNTGKIVIDLSADFRLHDPKAYEKWYGVKHRSLQLLKKAVYGLTELYRKEIHKADFIANPGCYPTAVILGLAPLLKKRLIDLDSIVVDAKSGVSGAGKKMNTATQFCEVDENFYAYKVGKHQHTPEMTQTLSEVAGKEIRLTFVPHLLPLDRGILATMYLKKKKGVSAAQIADAYQKSYGNETFVRVKKEGNFPELRDVQRTNYCDIGFWADPSSQRLIVITAIDNLLKGASGQAVQNMNVRLNFAEDEGLKTW